MEDNHIAEDIPTLLDFLEEVNKSKICDKEEPYLKNAWRRYEKLWIPFLRKNEESQRFMRPPLDVHWMWHLHFHNPYAYSKDLEDNILDHAYPSRTESNSTIDAWEKEYPSEPFDAPNDAEVIKESIRDFHTSFSYDLLEASKRQKEFFYQVSLPHFRNADFQRECMLRYSKFLELKKEHPGQFIVPYYDIDLAWHTHMSKPILYKEKTSNKFGGKMLDHNDSVGKGSLSDSHKETKDLWKEKYSRDYKIPGVCHRGIPPNGKLSDNLPDLSPSVFFKEASRQVKLDPAIYFTSKHPLKTMEYELNLKITESNPLGDKVVLDVEKIFSSEAPQENTLFFLDENEHNFRIGTYSTLLIRAEVTALKVHNKLCAFVFGTDTKTTLNLQHTIPPFWTAEDLKMNMELYNEGNLKINLEVNDQSEEIGGEKFFNTVPGYYGDHPVSDNFAKLMGSVPSSEVPLDEAAMHSVVDKKDDSKAFDVYLAHSLELGMSSIQVLRDAYLLSFAHLITPDTIDVSYISHFNKYKSSPWRSMIIKDNEGDWGILIGHWTGATKSVQKQGPSGLHLRGIKPEAAKPGYFSCTFHNLRSNDVVDFDLPNKSSQIFGNEEFSVHIPNKMSVNMNTGEVVIHSGAGTEVAQYTALSFAVSVLYLLVLPTPEDIELPKRAHVPEKHQPLFYKSKDQKYFALGGINKIRKLPSNSTYYYRKTTYSPRYYGSTPYDYYLWHGYHHDYHCYNDNYFHCDVDHLNNLVFDNDGEVKDQSPVGPESGGTAEPGSQDSSGSTSGGGDSTENDNNDNGGGEAETGGDSAGDSGGNAGGDSGETATADSGDTSGGGGNSGGGDTSGGGGGDTSGGGGGDTSGGGGGDTSGGGGGSNCGGGGDTSGGGGGGCGSSCGGGGGCGSSCGGGD